MTATSHLCVEVGYIEYHPGSKYSELCAFYPIAQS